METTNQEITGTKAIREYKDTVFRMLFKDPVHLLSLYNAMSGKAYTDPDELKIVTLENAIYFGIKDDLAFIIRSDLYLYEQQSSVNPNMPLRFLLYVADEYQMLTANRKIYGTKLISLKTPHFVVFYNGVEPQPETRVLKLSDAYTSHDEEVELELRVRVLNINDGFNTELKEQCKILNEYMLYVDCVRKYLRDYQLNEAVPLAVDECIRKNILRDFLIRNKSEVMKVSIYEYDAEEERKCLREEGYEEGLEKGLEQGHEKGLKDGRLQTLAEFVRGGLIKKSDALAKYGVAEADFEKAFNALPEQQV